jgi:hypothetical protein
VFWFSGTDDDPLRGLKSVPLRAFDVNRRLSGQRVAKTGSTAEDVAERRADHTGLTLCLRLSLC